MIRSTKAGCSIFSNHTMRLWLVLLTGLIAMSAKSQITLTYPVEVNIAVYPPYSPYIDDYKLAGFDRLIVDVRLKDAYQNDDVNVNLMLQLIDVTNDQVHSSGLTYPVTLQKGVVTYLTGYDLEALIAPLPNLNDGLYQFKVIAYEADGNLNNQLSRGDDTPPIFNVTKNDPPFLNLPVDGSIIDGSLDLAGNPINFTWTPRHVSFNTLGTVKYLLEIWDYVGQQSLDVDPNVVVQNSTPVAIWIDNGLTFYNLSSSALLPNYGQSKRYAWRITAYDYDAENGSNPRGNAGSSIFENNGRSEVFSFYFTEPCNPPDLLEISTDNPQEIAVSVVQQFNHTGYDFMYRTFGTQDNFEVVHSTSSGVVLTDLAPNTTYELAVQVLCNDVSAPVKDLGNASTLDAVNESCVEPAFVYLDQSELMNDQLAVSWQAQYGPTSYDIELTSGSEVHAVMAVTTNPVTIDLPAGFPKTGAVSVQMTQHCATGDQVFDYTFTLGTDNEFQGICSLPHPINFVMQALPENEWLNGEENTQVFSWNADQGVKNDQFALKYWKYIGESNPDKEDVLVNEARVSGLLLGQSYFYEIDYTCLDGSIITTPVGTFTVFDPNAFTDVIDEGTGSCFAPANSLVEVVSANEVKIIWDKARHNVGYQLMYKPIDATGWEIVNQFERDITLSNLFPSTEYEYQIRTECEDGWSLYTPIKNFETYSGGSGSPFSVSGLTVLTDAAADVCEDVGEISLSTPGAGKTYLNLEFTKADADWLAYQVEYKSEDQPLTSWYNHIDPVTSNDLTNVSLNEPVNFSLQNLYAGKEYEVRIKALCSVKESNKSKVYKFSTVEFEPPLIDYECGSAEDLCGFASTPTAPESINAGDEFSIGGFTLTAVDAPSGTYPGITTDLVFNTSDGVNGFAVANVPYLNMASVELQLENVKLAYTSEGELCAYDGKAVVKATIVRVIPEEWSEVLNGVIDDVTNVMNQVQHYSQMGADFIEQLNLILETVSEPIDMTPYDGWGATELFEEGTRLYEEHGETFERVIKGNIDGIEDVTTVIQQGKVAIALMKKAYELGVEAVEEVKSLDCTNDFVVHFETDGSTEKFDGYDPSFENGIFKAFYEVLQTKDAAPQEYIVPYFAIDQGAIETVIATVTVSNLQESNLSFVKNSVLGQAFGKQDELVFERIGSSDQFKVHVPSDAKRVFALYDDGGDSPAKIGKLAVVDCAEKKYDVVIVPNSDESESFLNSNLSSIEDQINRVYDIPNVTFTLEVGSVNTDMTWDLEGDGLEIEDHKVMSLFSEEMKRLTDNYFSTHTENKEKAYLFLVDQMIHEGHSVLGFMPRGRGTGFVKLSDHTFGETMDDFSQNVAHELGHGLLGLKHNWEISKNIPEGETSNLMSYGGGYGLKGLQWAWIQDPSFEIYLFGSSDESLLLGDILSKNSLVLGQIEQEFETSNLLNFMSPAGEIIVLDNSKILKYHFHSSADGTLSSFDMVLEDGTVQTIVSNVYPDGQGFAGFYKIDASGAIGGEFIPDYNVEVGNDVRIFYAKKAVDDCHVECWSGFIKNENDIYSVASSVDGLLGKPKTMRFHEIVADPAAPLYVQNNTGSFWCPSGDDKPYYSVNWFPQMLPHKIGRHCCRPPEEYTQWYDELVLKAAGDLYDQAVRIHNNPVYYDGALDYVIGYDQFAQLNESPYGIDFWNNNRDDVMKLEHRLKFLDDHTNGETIMYVMFIPIPVEDKYFLHESDFHAFAEDVLAASNLVSQNSATTTVLVTIPYAQAFDGGVTRRVYSQPGMHLSDLKKFDSSYMQDVYKEFQLVDYMWDVYRSLYKPSTTHWGFIDSDGLDVTYTKTVESSRVAGRNACVEIKIAYKPEYWEIHDKTSTQAKCEANFGEATGTYPNYSETIYNEKHELIKELWVAEKMEESLTSDWVLADQRVPGSRWKELNPYDFKENVITDQLAEDYITKFILLTSAQQFWQEAFESISYGGSDFAFIKENEIYNYDNGVVIDKLVYGSVDVLSIPLSFVGLDFLTDGVGFVYASVNGDAFEASIYFTATLVPIANGSAAKSLGQAIRFTKATGRIITQGFHAGVGLVKSTMNVRSVRIAKYLGFKETAGITSLGADILDDISRIDYWKAGRTQADVDWVTRIRSASTDEAKLKELLSINGVSNKIDDVSVNYYDELASISRNTCGNSTCGIDEYACFSGETLVKGKYGFEEIQNINIGDTVWSFNHELNLSQLSVVSSVSNKKVNKQPLTAILLLSPSS